MAQLEPRFIERCLPERHVNHDVFTGNDDGDRLGFLLLRLFVEHHDLVLEVILVLVTLALGVGRRLGNLGNRDRNG